MKQNNKRPWRIKMITKKNSLRYAVGDMSFFATADIMNKNFYLISISHPRSKMVADLVQIKTTPIIYGFGILEDGLYVQHNQTSIGAHGSFSTIEEATAAALKKFGKLVEIDGIDTSGDHVIDDVMLPRLTTEEILFVGEL